MSKSSLKIPAPVRLGFFLPHLKAGGIERVVLNLLQRLDRSRFAPTLILGTRIGELLPEVPPDVVIENLSGVKLRSALPALYRALKRMDLDLIYSGTNAANLALLAAVALIGSHRPRVVISEHTLPHLYLDEAKWPSLRLMAMRQLYARADLIVTPLADLGAELRHMLGRPSLPVAELLNPLFDFALVDPGKNATAISPLPNNARFFVAAGRLSKVKAYDELLREFAQVARDHHDVHLVLLGEGEERQSLELLRESLQLGGRVHFKGFVPNPKNYFAAAVALVISSKREGTPNVIPEAMAVGLPVIALDCSIGIRRLLQGGDAGLIIPPNQQGGLSRAMSQLLHDSDLRQRFMERGFAQARKFSFESAISRYESVFIDVVGKTGDYRGPITSRL